MAKAKDRWYIVSWSTEGIECCIDISEYHPDEWAKKELFQVIKDGEGEENPIDRIVSSMALRARYNPQRHYEIYVFTSTPSITLDDIKEMYETNVQYFVDWVREHHMRKILDNRQMASRQVIH